MNIQYCGVRPHPNSCGYITVSEGRTAWNAPLLKGYQELLNLSPFMDWGTYSAGCDQLAFAILVHYISKTEKVSLQEAYIRMDSRMVNAFSARVVSKLDYDFWKLNETDIKNFLEGMDKCK